MAKITAAEVNNLRKQTGAGMMDCKNALVEADGDFEMAVDILRKKGQKIAAKRADRDATEGAVLSKSSADHKVGVLISLNCETDFVAKNEQFLNFANGILDIAMNNLPETKEALLGLPFDGSLSVSDKITEQTGVIGEKLELAAYELVRAEHVSAYIHAGNKSATLVGLSATGDGVEEAGRDVAMQVAAMSPIALNEDEVDEATIERELEVGRDLARQEGKPEAMLDKIAQGRLNKFFKESTLVHQQFIKDSKLSVAQYLDSVSKGLKATSFKRVGLGV